MNSSLPLRHQLIKARWMKTLRRRDGSALLVVLAFVLLLTVITLAFLSRSLLEKKVSDASAYQTRTDVFASSAVGAIISDFQAEIAAGSGGVPTALTQKTTPYISTGFANTKVTIYTPYVSKANPYPVPLSMVPSRTWTSSANPTDLESASLYPNPLPNLLKCSRTGVNSGAFFYPSNDKIDYPNAGTYPPTEMAFANPDTNDSTKQPSLNGRAYTAQRWNLPLLLPKATPNTTDITPVASFIPPDWILVRRDGTNATSFSTAGTTSVLSAAPGQVIPTNANPVVGRYAYTVYDEGGLLDMNVAGYPITSGTNTGPPNYNYKTTLASADLTQLKLTDGLSDYRPSPSGAQLLDKFAINAIVGWRNYATLRPSGTFPSYPSFSPSSLQNYFQNIMANTSGLLTGNTALSSGATGQTDRKFASRQQLIDLLVNGIAPNDNLANLQNALQFMGTFSRDLNAPSYQPDGGRPRLNIGPPSTSDPGAVATNMAYAEEKGTPTSADGTTGVVNPSFLTNLVTTSLTRFDGSAATKGEPMVKRRFALNRLAWLTYQGPSADRSAVISGSPSATPGNADYDIYQLENNYGISQAFLQQGTDANIQAYFGLTWGPDPKDNNRSKWTYADPTKPLYHTTTNSSSGSIKTRITDLGGGNWGMVNNLHPHDPDFFELLKASILVGSKGRSLTYYMSSTSNGGSGEIAPWNYNYALDNSYDYQILQIGANIIAQFQPTNYAPEILFSCGSGDNTDPVDIVGVENLPYFYRVRLGDIGLRTPTPNLGLGDPDPAYSATTFKDTGVGAVLYVPEIWNPHDVNAPVGSPGPTNFRIVADSCDPYNIRMGNTAAYTTVWASGEGPTSAGSNQSINATLKPYFTAGQNGAGASLGIGSGAASFNPALTGQYLNSTNSPMTFTIPQVTAPTTSTLFREPTMLVQPGLPKGSKLALGWTPGGSGMTGIWLNAGNIMNSLGNNAWDGNGFIADTVNNNPLDVATLPAKNDYLGFLVGFYPLEFTGAGVEFTSDILGAVSLGAVTFRMQYQDPVKPSNWVTYDTKYVEFNNLEFIQGYPPVITDAGSPVGRPKDSADQATGWKSFADPRTARFGTPGGKNVQSGYYSPTNLYSDPSNNVLVSDRPDNYWGFTTRNWTGSTDYFGVYIASGWSASKLNGQTGFINWMWGPYSQNVETFKVPTTQQYNGNSTTDTSTGQNLYYADPDAVVRRAMGGFQPAMNNSQLGTTTGLPMATTLIQSGSTYNPSSPGVQPLQNQSRPYFLHRPFRSVAELGYVFSGTPWKDLDFFTPESGDSALLDTFCISDTDSSNGLVAGRVNLNTQQAPVLWAILGGAYKDEVNPTGNSIGLNDSGATAEPTPNPTTGTPDYSVADVAKQLIGRTGYTTKGLPITLLTSPRDLVGRWNSKTAALSMNGAPVPFPYIDAQLTTNFDGFSNDLTNVFDPTLGTASDKDPYTAYVQRFRESAIRALSAVGETRVWNVMIDVVAQTGRFPSTAQNASNFLVEGERRYWVHVAIDRFTGQVLDQQIEEVKQ